MKPQHKKKFFLALIIVACISGAFYYPSWHETKMRKVELGLFRETFPYRDYSQKDLSLMYPQVIPIEAETTVTPQET